MHKSFKLLVLPLSLACWHAAAQPSASTNAPVAAKPALKASDLFPDTVVAKAKSFEIKRSQLDEEVIRFKSQAAGRGEAIPAEANDQVERYVLNQLIQVQLLKSKATDADKAAAKVQAEKRFDEAKTRLGADEMDREMKLLSTSREELITKWTELGAADTATKRELKANVTDDEVKKFFDDNQAHFEQPELAVASHILLSTRDAATREEASADQKAAKRRAADELLKRARSGEDFAKLAKEYSEDPGSKKRGGEYEFPRGQMMREFEDAAFSLNTNQVSEVVTTAYGYHIIKLSEKIPARKTGLNDEVIVVPTGQQSSYVVLKDNWRDPETVTNAVKVATLIRENLENQQFQKALPGYLDKLRKDSNLEILDEKLKAPPESSRGPAAGMPVADPKAK